MSLFYITENGDTITELLFYNNIGIVAKTASGAISPYLGLIKGGSEPSDIVSNNGKSLYFIEPRISTITDNVGNNNVCWYNLPPIAFFGRIECINAPRKGAIVDPNTKGYGYLVGLEVSFNSEQKISDVKFYLAQSPLFIYHPYSVFLEWFYSIIAITIILIVMGFVIYWLMKCNV